MAKVKPWPFDGPPIGEQFKSHPIRDKEEVAPWVVAYFFLREVEHLEYGGHEKRIKNPSQRCSGGGIPNPPGGGYIPYKESQK